MNTKTPMPGEGTRQEPLDEEFAVDPLDILEAEADEGYDPFEDLTPEEIEQGQRDYQEAMICYENGDYDEDIAELRKNKDKILDNVMDRIAELRKRSMALPGVEKKPRLLTATEPETQTQTHDDTDTDTVSDTSHDPLRRCRDASALVSGSLASGQPGRSRVQNNGRHVRIIDVTLREGLARAGGLATVEDRVSLGLQIARIGVDGIELGTTWAARDLTLVKAMTSAVLKAQPEDLHAPLILTALCRCHGHNTEQPREVSTQIDHLADAFRSGAKDFDNLEARLIPGIHLFAETSHDLRQITTHLNDEELIEQVTQCVSHARSKGCFGEIQFSAMDGTRAPFGVLVRVFRAAIEAGATTVNIADTAGLATPAQITAMIENLRAEIAEIRDGRVILSVHLHNALGMSTASAVAACAAGARQIEASVNGIGPRGGNTALEEVVMALHVQGDGGRLRTSDLVTRIKTSQLLWISQLVSSRTGEPVASSKPIVGRDQLIGDIGVDIPDVESRDVVAYDPRAIGCDGESNLIRGITRKGLENFLKRHAVTLPDDRLKVVFHEAREVIRHRGCIEEAELLSLARPTQGRYWTLMGVTATSAGMEHLPLACARLRRGKSGEVREETATGSGPIAAIFRAIDRVTGLFPKAMDYQVRSTSDVTSHAQVMVVLAYEHKGEVRNFRGSATATDILFASAQAYLDAVNQIQHWLAERHARPAVTRKEVARAAGEDQGQRLLGTTLDGDDVADAREIVRFDPNIRPTPADHRPLQPPRGHSR